jgi:hypothetical protein
MRCQIKLQFRSCIQFFRTCLSYVVNSNNPLYLVRNSQTRELLVDVNVLGALIAAQRKCGQSKATSRGEADRVENISQSKAKRRAVGKIIKRIRLRHQNYIDCTAIPVVARSRTRYFESPIALKGKGGIKLELSRQSYLKSRSDGSVYVQSDRKSVDARKAVLVAAACYECERKNGRICVQSKRCVSGVHCVL